MSFPLLKGLPRKHLVINLSFIDLPFRTLPHWRTRGLPSPSKGWPGPGWAVGSAIIVAALSSFLVGPAVWFPVSANDPEAVMEVCRAGVEPCQREVHAAVGEPVALDLLISVSSPDPGKQPLNLVAWETHFSLVGDGEFQLVGQSLANQSAGNSKVGLPVRERGHSRYALEGLERLEAEAPDPDADYYAAQNRFDEETGQLDYAVALLGSAKSQPLPSYPPGDRQDHWLLGRIVFSGQSPGSIQVSPNTAADLPSQAISLSGLGERLPVPLSASSPLATVKVSPSGATLNLEGLIAGSSSMELVLTFWNPGAVPTWRQGPDEPVATFRELVSDANGRFRIADISPTILPPGPYDLRVKARNTLGSRATRVTIPDSDSEFFASGALAVEWDSLRYGDVDDNHGVDDADVAALKTSFGRRPGESGFNSQADFNSDKVVDGQDFSLLAQNYLSRSQ